jgi:hypothetical protein
MVNGNGLLRIFWPSDTPRTTVPGTIVGWRNSELDVFVVAVLQGVEVLPICAVLERNSNIIHSHEMLRMRYVLDIYSVIANILLIVYFDDAGRPQCMFSV